MSQLAEDVGAEPVFAGLGAGHMARFVIDTLKRIQALVLLGEVRISLHGYDELAADEIPVRDVIAGLSQATIVEDYPTYGKGPCVLVLQRDSEGQPVHVVWGIVFGRTTPAVLVTAYRPDPRKWDESWRRRRT
jgi:hypothetical protein